MQRTSQRCASLLAALLLAPFTSNFAADLNGYNAEYECRAGGPRCNVDVSSIAAQSCQQIIEPGTPWDDINWSNNVVCLRAGNHISKGPLILWQSGTAGARRVLRCVTSAGEECADPWTTETRAELRQIIIDGADFVIIDRVAIPASTAFVSDGDRISLRNDADNNIISRVLIEGRPSPGVPFYGAVAAWMGAASDNTTFQNSVVRTNYGQTGWNCVGIAFENGENNVIVNNELYDWCEHTIQHGHNGGGYLPGTVVENNDVYNTPAFDGYSEALTVSKAYGSAANPMKWIGNRMWHNRWGTNTSEGGGGTLLSLADNLSTWATAWTLIQDNIFMDAYDGVSGYRYLKHHISMVGNIFYQIRDFDGRLGEESTAVLVDMASNAEMYFNTVVASDRWAHFGYDGTNNDVLGNVAIDAGLFGSPRPGDAVDYNTYYNATNGPDGTKIDRGLNVRGDNTRYDSGAVMRTTTNHALCTAANDPDCFLYMATNDGTTGSSPNFCTTLGCTFQDGGVTWQAIRGPHTFYRKLKTAPEQVVIPYARVHASAPEVRLSGSNIGPRPDIGINNDAPGTGILATDAAGTARTGTPGAFEAGGGGSPPPPPPPGQTPYLGTPFVVPGNIQAEDYDLGGEGIAYHDTSATNEPGAYRSDAVDVELTQDAGGGHDVGWVSPGEWLEYTINVQSAGTYDIEIRHASSGPGGTMHVEFYREGAQPVTTEPIALPDTGGWQTWSTTTAPGVNLSDGQQVMRLAFDTGVDGWLANINYINIATSGSTLPPPCYAPYLGAPIAIPGTIEAEHYDLGGEGCAYHDTTAENEPGALRTDGVDIEATQDTGGGYDVGWVTPGEWLQYSVNVATAGAYTLEVRYATQGFGGNMHIEFDGQNKTGSIALPDTGGWQTWGTVSVPVTLNAGEQIMRLAFDTGNNGWLANINYVRITAGIPQPSLSGQLATPPAIVNLTSEGTADWIHGASSTKPASTARAASPLCSATTPSSARARYSATTTTPRASPGATAPRPRASPTPRPICTSPVLATASSTACPPTPRYER